MPLVATGVYHVLHATLGCNLASGIRAVFRPPLLTNVQDP
jgi:hypothetical protein